MLKATCLGPAERRAPTRQAIFAKDFLQHPGGHCDEQSYERTLRACFALGWRAYAGPQSGSSCLQNCLFGGSFSEKGLFLSMTQAKIFVLLCFVDSFLTTDSPQGTKSGASFYFFFFSTLVLLFSCLKTILNRRLLRYG